MSYEKHGDTGTRLYRIWKSMKCRCCNSNHPSYKNYGKRGISVCEEWKRSYTNFKVWAILHGYSEQLELERVNVNQGYSPENCKWITHYEQTLNRRDTLYVVFGNTVIKLQDLCNEQGINKNTVNSWRYSGNLEEKLSALLGQTVTITGGKKEVVCV